METTHMVIYIHDNEADGDWYGPCTKKVIDKATSFGTTLNNKKSATTQFYAADQINFTTGNKEEKCVERMYYHIRNSAPEHSANVSTFRIFKNGVWYQTKAFIKQFKNKNINAVYISCSRNLLVRFYIKLLWKVRGKDIKTIFI